MSLDANNEDFAAFVKKKGRVVNHRRAVRYIRKDIVTWVYKCGWFDAIGLDWFRRKIPVELLDISSRGCLIVSVEKLAVQAKIVVLLKFNTGKYFEIKGTVVRKSGHRGREYGIKFAGYNDELGEYMLMTQSELLIK